MEPLVEAGEDNHEESSCYNMNLPEMGMDAVMIASSSGGRGAFSSDDITLDLS